MIFLNVCNRRLATTENKIGLEHSIVSISTPGDSIPKVVTNAHTHGVLHLQFHDADASPGGLYTLFDMKMARAIVAFVRQWQESGVQTFRIHCDAGHSRSVAVAEALAKYFNGNDMAWGPPAGAYGEIHTPNRLVYRLMLDALMESEYE